MVEATAFGVVTSSVASVPFPAVLLLLGVFSVELAGSVAFEEIRLVALLGASAVVVELVSWPKATDAMTGEVRQKRPFYSLCPDDLSMILSLVSQDHLPSGTCLDHFPGKVNENVIIYVLKGLLIYVWKQDSNRD